MKYRILITITLALACQLVNAGEITDTPYASGDLLTAVKMNNIRNAVNDNDSRVRAIETQTSNLANGCLANEYIQAIAKNGDLSCVEDMTTSITPKTDYYFITGSELEPVERTDETEWHAYDIRGQYAFPVTDGEQYVGHGVRLPDGATITEMQCGYYDNDPSFDIVLFRFNLYERDYTEPGTPTSGVIVTQNLNTPTSGQSTSIKQLTESGLNHIVDNANNAYYMRLRFEASPGYNSTLSVGEENQGAGDSNIRTYGCRIKYTH